MIRRATTTERMALRVGELLAQFGSCLDEFEKSKVFSGPSIYFHEKAVTLRRNKSLQQAGNDDVLVEAVYATLASWGMHRMGPRGAKLVEFGAFKAGIQKALPVLIELESKQLAALSTDEVDTTADKIWEAITLASPSASDTQIVAGTKALHHFLPDLIAPIDRTYTLTFFYSHKKMVAPERDTLREIFQLLQKIAADPRSTVLRSGPMYSSKTKTIDNAIVGYVRRTMPGADED